MTALLLADRRDHVIEQLALGYAGSAFEVDELERRLALAHSASSPAELDSLVTDLVPASTALVPAKHLRVVFGSIERMGPWTVPSRLSARVVCGNLLLDLRDARLGRETTIEVDCTFGNVEVIVPPHVSVDVDARAFLGNVEERTFDAGATTFVRVTGRVRFGNLEVFTRR